MKSAVFAGSDRRARFGFIVLVLAALINLSCDNGVTHTPPGGRQTLRLTRTIMDGSLASEYSRLLASTAAVELVPPNLSRLAVEAISAGDADIGAVFADHAYFAYWGSKRGDEHRHLRGVAVLQTAPVHLLLRKGAGVSSVGGLRGRRVAVGLDGSTSATITHLVLQAFRTDVLLTEGSQTDAVRQIIDGTVDATFVAYPPFMDTPIELALRQGAYLLPIEGAEIEGVRREYPFLRPATITISQPAGHLEKIRTVGIDIVFVCRSDLGQTVVYEITKQLFNALAILSGGDPSLSFVDLDAAAATLIPLHDGASRYYREQQLSR